MIKCICYQVYNSPLFNYKIHWPWGGISGFFLRSQIWPKSIHVLFIRSLELLGYSYDSYSSISWINVFQTSNDKAGIRVTGVSDYGLDSKMKLKMQTRHSLQIHLRDMVLKWLSVSMGICSLCIIYEVMNFNYCKGTR